ncbi:glucose-6-phosphate dehydrogenase [Marinilabiliaceae bacterium ANBcel2]|nr:glucose-6-phosphate dehydrogenase [Marinilabiliaceae bacterium ANBcel2]
MRKPEKHILIIFGASGDLTYRKLIPSIFDLYNQNLLPEKFGVLGVGRSKLTNETFREKMGRGIENFSSRYKSEKSEKNDFLKMVQYYSFNTKDENEYNGFNDYLQKMDNQLNTDGNFIFYLATPPAMYSLIPQFLAQHNLNSEEKGFKRLIVEKPFGYDLQSAQELNAKLLEAFNENQIYRIDHYLGKETVQNLMVTRFANGIFEPLWNRRYIHHIEITSAEDIGVEGRGGYYEDSGAMRDMVQNHLMLLASLVAMEPPAVVDADSLRNEIVKVLQSLRPIPKDKIEEHVVRGQYTASTIKDKHIPGYREEKGVNPQSRTETFVAMKFFIDNWRWSGVPFYIRTGKYLPTRVTEVVIHYQKTPHHIFSHDENVKNEHNQLVIRIQPDEGILIKYNMKMPGGGFEVQNVNMDFHYRDLNNTYLPSAYERLLLDAMLGDATLYSRGDAVEAAWKFIDPVIKAWKSNPNIKMHGYPAGTWGPEESDKLIEDTKTWRYPCKNLEGDGEYCEL